MLNEQDCEYCAKASMPFAQFLLTMKQVFEAQDESHSPHGTRNTYFR
jgi:hypothetical protein